MHPGSSADGIALPDLNHLRSSSLKHATSRAKTLIHGKDEDEKPETPASRASKPDGRVCSLCQNTDTSDDPCDGLGFPRAWGYPPKPDGANAGLFCY